MKIVISKDIKKFMGYAKQISEIEGRETGFLFHYFNLPVQNNVDKHDIFHTELVIGQKMHIRLRSKYSNFLSGLENKIVICGSFHTHSNKKYLDSYENDKDENRLVYVKECCQNYLSFSDLKMLLANIVKRDPVCMITCVLSDIDNQVSYYIPKKHISIEEFENINNRLRNDFQPQVCTETIYTQKGSVTFPTPEYRKMYGYVFDLFDENKFDLNSEETIIDI